VYQKPGRASDQLTDGRELRKSWVSGYPQDRVCDGAYRPFLLSVGPMRRQIGHKSRSFASSLRGVLTAFLAMAYVVVGVGGEISCAEEQEQATIGDQFVAEGLANKADQDSKKPVTVVDHCYTCVPLLLPAPVLVVEPAARPAALTFTTPTFVLEDHPRLDTPPPKKLA
jgi:hypothetical protein